MEQIRALLERYAHPCAGDCEHSQCPLLRELHAIVMADTLERARQTIKPTVDLERKGEFIGDLMNMRLHATPASPSPAEPRPRIICLCGSTRFYKEFQRANYEETMKGSIVLSVGFYMHESEAAHGEKWGCTPEQKIALDALHFRKIELADEVLVLDVNGYIGESTRNEINHATALRKPIRYRSQEIAPACSAATRHCSPVYAAGGDEDGELPIEDLERDHYRDHPPEND